VRVDEECKHKLRTIAEEGLKFDDEFKNLAYRIALLCALSIPLVLGFAYLEEFRVSSLSWAGFRGLALHPSSSWWNGDPTPSRGVLVCLLAVGLILGFHILLRALWPQEWDLKEDGRPSVQPKPLRYFSGVCWGLVVAPVFATYFSSSIATLMGPMAIFAVNVFLSAFLLDVLVLFVPPLAERIFSLYGEVAGKFFSQEVIPPILVLAAIWFVPTWTIIILIVWFSFVFFLRALPRFFVFTERPFLLLGLSVLLAFGPAMIFALLWNGPPRYQLQTQTSQAGPQREAAEGHASRWLEAQVKFGGGDRTLQPVIVVAEGGGMRAALHTASVLAELDKLTGGKFYNHIYSMSGVSGGALGIAAYVATRLAPEPTDPVSQVQRYLAHDHLSPLLIGSWVDMFHSTLPDRATLLQNSLEQVQPLGDAMRRSFVDAIVSATPSRFVPPIVVMNTTNAGTGEVEVISNAGFSDPTAPGPTIEAPCNVLERLPSGQTLSLAGAAVLSARFPLITPPGLIIVIKDKDPCGGTKDTWVRYVDGGYLDNSGALGAQAALTALMDAANELKFGAKRPGPNAVPKGPFPNLDLQPIVLRIYSRPVMLDEQAQKRSHSARNLADIQVPADALTAARRVQGLSPVSELCQRIVKDLYSGEKDRYCNQHEMCSVSAGNRCNAIRQTRASNRFDDEMPIVTDYCDKGAVPWLNAELDISTDPTDAEHYVPLGWLLGPSKDYVERTSAAIAEKIFKKLGPDLNLRCPN
jgi:hypothetical protein